MGLTYENAVPTSMIGASNHFQGAIATAAMLYGLSTGAALATVVGVLIEKSASVPSCAFRAASSDLWRDRDIRRAKAARGLVRYRIDPA